MKASRTFTVIIGALLALDACGSVAVSPSGPAQASSSGPTLQPISSPTATPSSAGGGGSGNPVLSPGALDPCTLLSAVGASTLVGNVTFGAGKEAPLKIGRLCVYGDTGTNTSVTVAIIQEPNAADAMTEYTAAVAGQVGFTKGPVPAPFPYTSVISRAPLPAGHYGSGIYVIDGSNVFFVTAMGPGGGPSDGELKAAAELVLGGLP